MRSFFPDHDIGKKRKYTGWFQNTHGARDKPYIFVKLMEGTIVSNRELSFPRIDKHYKRMTKWMTVVAGDTKEGRKTLRQIAHDLTKLTISQG